MSPKDLVWCAEHQPELFGEIATFAGRIAKEEAQAQKRR